jgi:Tfp pilus assembly protein PilF
MRIFLIATFLLISLPAWAQGQRYSEEGFDGPRRYTENESLGRIEKDKLPIVSETVTDDEDPDFPDDEADEAPAIKRPVKNSAKKSAKKASNEIPLDGFWRSDAALIEAEKMLTAKKYVDALTLLDQVIARNPRNTDAFVDMALAWLNLRNIGKAKNAITSALIIDKKHLGAYVISGLISLMEKDVKQAEYHLSALRILCRGTTCPEYQTLQRIIRETDLGQ